MKLTDEADLVMAGLDIDIVPLIEAQEALAPLAALYRATWPPYYGPGGPGDALADLREAAREDGMPYAVVARDGENAPLGVAALRASSIGDELGLGPWLAGIAVAPDMRGRGIATALIAAIEEAARAQGFAALYTSTRILGGGLERRGWRLVGETGRALDAPGAVPVYGLTF